MSKETIQYNSQGQIKKIVDFDKECEHIFTYHSNGKVKTHIYKSKLSSECKEEYDFTGRMIRLECEYGISEYTYQNDGSYTCFRQLKNAVLEHYYDCNGELFKKINRYTGGEYTSWEKICIPMGVKYMETKFNSDNTVKCSSCYYFEHKEDGIIAEKILVNMYHHDSMVYHYEYGLDEKLKKFTVTIDGIEDIYQIEDIGAYTINRYIACINKDGSIEEKNEIVSIQDNSGIELFINGKYDRGSSIVKPFIKFSENEFAL